MQPDKTTAYVFADNEAPENQKRAIEIVMVANDEQMKMILDILDS